jgi:hypothetical protein
MKYYSTIKKNEIFFQGKWMELKNIMLSEVNQLQKDKCSGVFLICGR